MKSTLLYETEASNFWDPSNGLYGLLIEGPITIVPS
jgi:hypothetical protein